MIGTGANDPQKMDPKASRETLDHSIMYIFAVALQDGGWHHERSYAPERARRARHGRAVAQDLRPSRIPSGRGATTATIPTKRRSAAASSITLKDGSGHRATRWRVADAHPSARGRSSAAGLRPEVPRRWPKASIAGAEQDRFLGRSSRLAELKAGELAGLNFTVVRSGRHEPGRAAFSTGATTAPVAGRGEDKRR